MKSRGAVVSVFGLYAAYFLCYLIKISPSAIMPQLQAELGLTSSQAGLISSMYFFPYALSQFFVGSLCRRFTPHVVCSAGLILSVAGLAMFGYGNTVAVLAIGRFLLGLGTSPFFISLVFYLQKACEGDEYVRIYGYGIIVGNVASAIASYPVQAFLSVYSRQALSFLIGVVTLSLAIFLLALKKSSGVEAEKAWSGNILKLAGSDIACTMGNPVLVCALLIWFIQCACLMSYQGLWCVKWTSVAFGRMTSFSGLSGVFVSVGVVLSGAFSEKLRIANPLTRKDDSRGLSLFLCGILSLVSVLLTVGIKLLPSGVFAFMLSLISDIMFGYAGGNIIVQGGAFIKTHASVGRNAGVMGVLNGFGCLIQQLSQWLTGIGIDFFARRTTLNRSFSYTYLVLTLLIAFVMVSTRRLLGMEDGKQRQK